MVEVFTRVTGKKAQYVSAYGTENFLQHFPEYASNELLVEEIQGMAHYALKYGYFSNNEDFEWSRKINPAILNWEQFLRTTGWTGQKIVY